MSQALLVILYLLAAAILVPLIGVLGFWLKGVDSIALPGLGIIVATPLLVALGSRLAHATSTVLPTPFVLSRPKRQGGKIALRRTEVSTVGERGLQLVNVIGSLM